MKRYFTPARVTLVVWVLVILATVCGWGDRAASCEKNGGKYVEYKGNTACVKEIE